MAGDCVKLGFLYILINDSFPGLIKIGSTVLYEQERARQLSSNTAVPTPFKVAYEVYVDDYDKLEKLLHMELSDFRVNPNREFFRYPLHKAIKLIQNMKNRNAYQTEDKYESMEIMPQLLQRFGKFINPKISSIRIYQTNDRVCLEYTEDEYIANHLKNQHITREDLGYIIEEVDIEEKTFSVNFSIGINVNRFLALDNYSMAIIAGKIFTDEWFKAL